MYFPSTTTSQGSSLRSLIQSGLDSSGRQDSGFPLSLNSSFTTPHLTLSTSDSFWSTGKRDLSTSGLGLTTSAGNLTLHSDQLETSQLDSSSSRSPRHWHSGSRRGSSPDAKLKTSRIDGKLFQESSSRSATWKVSPRSASLDRQEPFIATSLYTDHHHRYTPSHRNSLSPSLENVLVPKTTTQLSPRRERSSTVSNVQRLNPEISSVTIGCFRNCALLQTCLSLPPPSKAFVCLILTLNLLCF